MVQTKICFFLYGRMFVCLQRKLQKKWLLTAKIREIREIRGSDNTGLLLICNDVWVFKEKFIEKMSLIRVIPRNPWNPWFRQKSYPWFRQKSASSNMQWCVGIQRKIHRKNVSYPRNSVKSVKSVIQTKILSVVQTKICFFLDTMMLVGIQRKLHIKNDS